MKIGVFDSGFGGLSVLHCLLAQMPQLDFCYLADSARAPYGNATDSTIVDYTTKCLEWLLEEQGVDYCVIACNTASCGYDKLPATIRERSIEIIRPTVNFLAQYTQGPVGVLATKRTCESGLYENLLAQQGIEAMSVNAGSWVTIIESGGHLTAYQIAQPINQLLAKLPWVQSILLGCTHFPLIQSMIQVFVPQSVRLISQGDIIAQHLGKRHPLRLESGSGQCSFFTTGNPVLFGKRASGVLSQPILVKQVLIEQQ